MSTSPDGATVPPTPPKPRPGRAGRRAALVAAGALVGLGALYGIGYVYTGSVLPRGTTVAGVDVGGIGAADAAQKLQAELGPRAGAPVTLVAGDVTLEKPASDLGLAIDYVASTERVARPTLNPLEMAARLGPGHEHPAVVTVDQAKLGEQLAEVSASDHEPVDATLAYSGTTPKLTPGKDGQSLRVAAAAPAVTAAWPASQRIELPVDITKPAITTEEARQVLDQVAKPAVSGPVTLKAGDKTADLGADAVAASLVFVPTDGVLKPVLDPAKLASLTTERLKRLGARAPVDATIKISGGKPVVVESTEGYGVEPDALAHAVLPALTKTSGRVAEVTLAPVAPALDTAAAQKLGVKEVIGEFTTQFPGAYPYRYVNIPKAAGMLDNTLVKPGETFSMNAALGGERTAEKGWAAGFGISGGKEVVTLGGALSQVTTTLYNAVFFSGLEDVEHKPHSLYFSRYPKGREATLSYPDVDMKFRNDSPYGVVIQAVWTGRVGVEGTITFRLWGTKQYDVKQTNIKISNPVQVEGTTPAKDDSPTCVAQDAIDGFDIRYDREFWADGKLVKTVPYFWHYNTLQPTTCTNPVAIKAAEDRKVKPESGG